MLSLMACVFTVFLVTGAALPTIPLYIQDCLGFSNFTIGLVSGAQFAASLACRLWSGTISDQRGPKFAVTTGLVMAMLAGILYLGSLLAIAHGEFAIAILLLGRVLLGGAESFIMIGAQSWCLSLAGHSKIGTMISWIGTAMFVAMSLGALLGSVLFDSFGFASIGLATLLGSTATLLLVIPIPATKPAPQSRQAAKQVLKAVWIPGLAMAFSSVGYGVMTAFAVLLFVQRGWQPAWLSFTAFAAALMVARVLFGPLPDRLGGARTAMIFIMIHSLGLALIWLSSEAWLAFVGSAMAGFGYALVYPGFGMEAMARAPAQARGLAMGIYTAFIDLALGIFAPLLGLVANAIGLDLIIPIAALLALCAVPIAMWLRTQPSTVALQGNLR